MTPFNPSRIFYRDGEPVAEIKGDVRTLYIHREGGQLYHWDRPGLPVRNEEVAEMAGRMLDGKPEPGRYPERQCARCPDRFDPTGPKNYLCPTCRAAARFIPTPRTVKA